MEQADARLLIEVIAALTMGAGIVGVLWQRIASKKGLSVRSIQFLALVTLVPIMLILALEGILERSAVGALIGALIGYLFTNIGKYDQRLGERDDA